MANLLSDKIWGVHHALKLTECLEEMDNLGLARKGLFHFWHKSTHKLPVDSMIARLPADLVISVGVEIGSALINLVAFIVSIFDNAIPSIFTAETMKERSNYDVTPLDYGKQFLSSVGDALLHTLLLIPVTLACILAFPTNQVVTNVPDCGYDPRYEMV